MADNVLLNTGSGGETVATDDDGTAHHQYVKVEFGADNTQTKVTSSAGLPVTPDSGGFQVDLGTNNDVQGAVAEGAAVGSNPFLMAGDDGTNVKHVSVDANGNLQVDLVTAAVTNAGTFAVQVDGAALTSLQLIDDTVYADSDVWTDDTSKHVLVGGIYQAAPHTITSGDTAPISLNPNGYVRVNDVNLQTAFGTTALTLADDEAVTAHQGLLGMGWAVEIDGTDPTSVAEGDGALIRSDLNRRLLVSDTHPNLWRATDNGGTAETDTEVKAAPGANLSLYVTDIVFSTDTVDVLTIHEDEGGGSEAVIFGPVYAAANGGFTAHLSTPIRCTHNLSVGYTTTATGNHTLFLSGYVAP